MFSTILEKLQRKKMILIKKMIRYQHVFKLMILAQKIMTLTITMRKPIKIVIMVF